MYIYVHICWFCEGNLIIQNILGILLENCGVGEGMRNVGLSSWDRTSNAFQYNAWSVAMRCSVWLCGHPLKIYMDIYPCAALRGKALLIWHEPPSKYSHEPAKFTLACTSSAKAKGFLLDAVNNASVEISARTPFLARYSVEQRTLEPSWMGAAVEP